MINASQSDSVTAIIRDGNIKEGLYYYDGWAVFTALIDDELYYFHQLGRDTYFIRHCYQGQIETLKSDGITLISFMCIGRPVWILEYDNNKLTEYESWYTLPSDLQMNSPREGIYLHPSKKIPTQGRW